jgi:glucan-binding YG repeat protein
MIKKLLTTLLTLSITTTIFTPVFASTTNTTNTGWRYYYNDKMATDIVQVNDTMYYFNDEGILQTDCWINYGNYKMYADESGRLATGWKLIDNQWYYFSQSRIMQTGTMDINGKDYYFDSKDGHWIG